MAKPDDAAAPAAKPDDDYEDVTVENRDGFAFAAVCWRLADLAPASAPRLLSVLNARDADARLVPALAAGASGAVPAPGGRGDLRYDVAAAGVLPAERELYRSVRLRGPRAAEFVRDALREHRAWLFRRPAGGAVPRFAWNDDTGLWLRRGAAPRRPLSSVFLPGDARDRVFGAVRRFFDAESLRLYADKHVVPVRVELLEGVPGAGKSSLVTAVASELGRGVAVLNAAHDVAAAVCACPPGCVIVIEDVDCAFRGQDRRPFADLLAALDTPPEPTVVFLTTNDPAALDPALRRRVDGVVSFRHATREQAAAMHDFFLGDARGFQEAWAHAGRRGGGLTTSAWQKFLVRVAAGRAEGAAPEDAARDALPALDALADLVEVARAPMYV